MANVEVVDMTICSRMYANYKFFNWQSALKRISCTDTNVIDVYTSSESKKSSLSEIDQKQQQSRPASAADFFFPDELLTYETALGWSKSFRKLIQHPIGRILFKQHMADEENVENLLFYEAVETYRQLVLTADADALNESCREIYDQFCSESARTEVNLDSACRRNLNTNLKSPTRQTFDEAQSQICKLMERDVYPRFLRSDAFRDFLSELIPLKIVQSWTSSFYTLIKYDDGRRLFREFLSNEKADENLLFWEEVQNYKTFNELNKRKEKAREIYDEFVSPEGEREISIDNAIKSEIKVIRKMYQRKYKSAIGDLFNEAADAAYISLKRDYYPRFTKSEILTKFIEHRLETLKSPTKNKRPLSVVKNWSTDFECLMEHELGRQLLGEHLADEHADENLRFWESVQIYKSIQDERERKQRAREIFKEFVSTEAESEINIDDKSRQSVKGLYETGGLKVFDAAEDHVYMLMKRDSFPKFVKSNEYKKFLKTHLDSQKFLIPLHVIRTWADDFDQLIEHEYGRHLFAEFMQTEHSEENIEFWEIVEKYKSIDDSHLQKRRQLAREIFHEFVSTQAKTEINVDDKTRQMVKETYESGHVNAFDVAQNHIYTLMKRDSYPKFLKSTNFDKFITDVKRIKPTIPIQTVQEWSTNFDSLMRHDYGRLLFEEFINNEQNGAGDQSIRFWEAVQNYVKLGQQNADETKLKRNAKWIYQEYIAENASKEIGFLDNEIKQKIKENLDTAADAKIYQVAYNRVLRKLKKEHYPNFVQSQAFKDFQENNAEHTAKHSTNAKNN